MTASTIVKSKSLFLVHARGISEKYVQVFHISYLAAVLGGRDYRKLQATR